MNRQTIGGALNYSALATLHRPTDPARIAAEVMRLHSSGLTPQDISVALRVPLDEVINTIKPVGISSASAARPFHAPC